MLLLVPQGVPSVTHSGTHPWSSMNFPGCWADILAGGLQASKARMSPGGRSAPGSASEGSRHLDKHKGCRMVLSLFLLHISLSEMCQNYLLMAYNIKRLCVVGGWGRLRVLDEKLLGARSFIFRH